MPATVKQQTFPNYNRIDIEHLDVAVSNIGLTLLAEIVVTGVSRVFIQTQVSANALNKYVVSARTVKNAPYSILYASSKDFLNPKGLMVGSSGDLTSLEASSVGDFQMDVKGLYEIKIEVASGNAAGSTVSLFGSGS